MAVRFEHVKATKKHILHADDAREAQREMAEPRMHLLFHALQYNFCTPVYG